MTFANITQSSDPNVTVSTYDPVILEFLWPEWPALDSREKLQLLRCYSPSPDDETQDHNVTTIGLHRFLAQAMDPENTSSEAAALLVVGTGGSQGATATDQSLNTEVGEVRLTDTVFSHSRADLQVTTFIDATQLNGHDIDEVGIKSSEGILWNHAILDAVVEKTASKTVIVDVFFTYTNTPEA